MTRALPLTQRQAQTLLRAAEQEGAIIEVKIGENTYRLIPRCYAQERGPIDNISNPEAFESLEDYLAWRDRGLARENQGHTQG